MFGLSTGEWVLHSELDPRWNCKDRAERVGMGAPPKEAREKVEELTKKLGEPPEDLEYGYWKD